MKDPGPTASSDGTSLARPGAARAPDADGSAARFAAAPPRRFVLPAVLMLLSERPSHGYSLAKDLHDFDFGKIDRPTVYRALAQLEKDGFVEPCTERVAGARARHVFVITPLGERALAVWMSVIKEERDSLERVLRRYRSTGTLDAVLAEVEGGWAADLGVGGSPVAPTSKRPRRLQSVEPVATTAAEPDSDRADTPIVASAAPPARAGPTEPSQFRLVAVRSVALIEVRSTVGPISFGTIGLTGFVSAMVHGETLAPESGCTAEIEIDVQTLRSGNRVYDAELMRRIDARRFPTATVRLGHCAATGTEHRYQLEGALTFHGVTRPVRGTVDASLATAGRLIVKGEQVFDIRDFAVPSPTVLMLRIYPDVRVHLQVEAELEED